MTKLITILGITGTQGGSVANHFLKLAGWQIRGVTRNPSSEKAQSWKAKGVDMVKADHDDLPALKSAFTGAHAIFAVTDWAGNFTRVSDDSSLQQKAKEAGRTWEEYAGDLERGQGITIARAASDQTVLDTLERFVFSTLPAVSKISRGKYTHSWEFDSKAAAESYVREQLPQLNARMSTVTLGVFQETWRDISAFRPHKLADGSFEYVRLHPNGSHEEIPEVVASWETGTFVEALVTRHPAGTHVLGASEILTKPEYAQRWGKVMGVQVRTRDVDEDEFLKSYVPEGFELTLLDDLKFFSEFGYAGGNPDVKTPAELGIKTASLDEWFESQDWTDVLSGKLE